MDIREKLKEMAYAEAGPVLNMIAALALDGAVGTIIPGVGNMILAYKQKRAEKNIEILISQLLEHQSEFDEKLKTLDTNKLQEITDKYFDIITEYAINEKQQKKIEYIVNGYINLPEQGDFSEDFVLLYFDTLAELNLLDIRVLKLCIPGIKSDNSMQVMKDYKINSDQLKYVVDKLYRMGLCKQKIEKNIDRNFQVLKDYVTNNLAEEKELELVSAGDIGTHEISEFGKNFLTFFLNIEFWEDKRESSARVTN